MRQVGGKSNALALKTAGIRYLENDKCMSEKDKTGLAMA
jgi:hypothetical protein